MTCLPAQHQSPKNGKIAKLNSFDEHTKTASSQSNDENKALIEARVWIVEVVFDVYTKVYVFLT